MKLQWEDTQDVQFDFTVQFGLGYDFYGLDNLRLEAKGLNGNYLAWPSSGKWSLYRDTDGAMAFEKYNSFKECREAAERWQEDPVNILGLF